MTSHLEEALSTVQNVGESDLTPPKASEPAPSRPSDREAITSQTTDSTTNVDFREMLLAVQNNAPSSADIIRWIESIKGLAGGKVGKHIDEIQMKVEAALQSDDMRKIIDGLQSIRTLAAGQIGEYRANEALDYDREEVEDVD